VGNQNKTNYLHARAHLLLLLVCLELTSFVCLAEPMLTDCHTPPDLPSECLDQKKYQCDVRSMGTLKARIKVMLRPTPVDNSYKRLVVSDYRCTPYKDAYVWLLEHGEREIPEKHYIQFRIQEEMQLPDYGPTYISFEATYSLGDISNIGTEGYDDDKDTFEYNGLYGYEKSTRYNFDTKSFETNFLRGYLKSVKFKSGKYTESQKMRFTTGNIQENHPVPDIDFEVEVINILEGGQPVLKEANLFHTPSQPWERYEIKRKDGRYDITPANTQTLKKFLKEFDASLVFTHRPLNLDDANGMTADPLNFETVLQAVGTLP
jgi:hypothetical protein